MASEYTPVPPSRLPQLGTTVFSVMSALAQQHGAVNLGQGFPDFEGDPALPVLNRVDRACHVPSIGDGEALRAEVPAPRARHFLFCRP